MFIGSGRDLSDDNFYTVTVGLKSGVAIGKLAGQSRFETDRPQTSIAYLWTDNNFGERCWGGEGGAKSMTVWRFILVPWNARIFKVNSRPAKEWMLFRANLDNPDLGKAVYKRNGQFR